MMIFDNIKQHIRDYYEEYIIVLTLVLLLGSLLAYIIWEERQWQTFKIQHDCKPVEVIPGHYETVLDDGQYVMEWQHQQVAYRCNDDLIYWRTE